MDDLCLILVERERKSVRANAYVATIKSVYRACNGEDPFFFWRERGRGGVGVFFFLSLSGQRLDCYLNGLRLAIRVDRTEAQVRLLLWRTALGVPNDRTNTPSRPAAPTRHRRRRRPCAFAPNPPAPSLAPSPRPILNFLPSARHDQKRTHNPPRPSAPSPANPNAGVEALFRGGEWLLLSLSPHPPASPQTPPKRTP